MIFNTTAFTFPPTSIRLCIRLGEVANPETGWGLKDETWQGLSMLEKYGGSTVVSFR